MKKFSFILIILFTFFLIVSAIEVGGHLTEDTTWSPENNPYLVTSGVYVDSDVTLTKNLMQIITMILEMISFTFTVVKNRLQNSYELKVR